ncbi:ACR284Cp [Eremothecium gossypii ATCC 10895]|uniref:Glutathione synthetase n=1 Tax=Eremothecium gossypii (strain ATCC 10895 / CBS 109.51 / FGSC 9923 / NRRL Y-1056) TaxID=284811 RepID=Q75BI7_EREGS|nr:ACR284Cp [Eremothecium gossypii ATCC 10895]AAS51510.1 ACR284Cp [Eremothecium gossypii ATCC 10895]AEY95802.1 FACR284Cp [Eremothecium gossypii FDAG1]
MTNTIPTLPEWSAEEVEQRLLPELLQWSLANGGTIYPPGFNINQAEALTMTLFPTPLPRKALEKAVRVQTTYNELYARIAQDKNGWLSEVTEQLANFDANFTGRLWKLYLEAQAIGISQKIGLGVFRSDYLLDADSGDLKQVEFNTVSVSFAGLSTKVGAVHNFLNESGKYSRNGGRFYESEVPISESAFLLPRALASAADKYNSLTGSRDTIVAFIVQRGERNVVDQRILEYNLFERQGVKSVRLMLHEVHERTRLDPITKRLYLTSTGQEIAVVYFRTCYSPQDFASEQDWKNRLSLELSYAIKAPNLLTQLSGTKKVQQLLSEEAVLAKFLPADRRSDIGATFVNLYPLDDSPLGKEGKRLALEMPERYVLKPQREGGGNNIYKEDIPAFLGTIPEEEWNGYVLMELINPKLNENVLVRGQELFQEPLISELGIYGTILFSDEEIYSNDYAGWLLRSKLPSSNEGGVAAGFGCVDSMVLY